MFTVNKDCFNASFLKRYSSNINQRVFFYTKKNLYFFFLQKLEPTYIKQRSSLFLALIIFVGGSNRAFRSIFGLPTRGQRTWSNAKTSSRNQTILFNYKYNKLKRMNKRVYISKNLFLSEYINLFWQQQWLVEWRYGRHFINKLPVYKKKTNFIDISSIVNFNLYSTYSNPLKKQKTKNISKVTLGLPFGFSFLYSNQLKKLN